MNQSSINIEYDLIDNWPIFSNIKIDPDFIKFLKEHKEVLKDLIDFITADMEAQI
jgi:hypothetical protein